MKHLYLKCLLFGIFSLWGIKAAAYYCEVNGIYYNLVTNAKTASVTYGNNDYSGSVIIPPSFTYDGTTYSVTSIEEYAFSGCSGLTSVTIPNSVTSIGMDAFSCCSGLTSVKIGNRVTYIGFEAFYGCSGLTSVTIPNSVMSIEDYAFEDCSGLTSVIIEDGTKTLSFESWMGLSDICPVTTFTNCPLETLYLGRNIYIDWSLRSYSPFTGTPLTSVTIGNSVTSIGEWTFSGCSGLTSVTIGNSVTSIEDDAFNGCSGLTSVTIPNSVNYIGTRAFSGCSNLQKVNIDDITAWCRIDFSNSTANPLSCANHLYLNNQLITNLEIPNTVTSIKQYAFYNASDISSVVIPNSVTSIDNSSFTGCSGLKNVDINISTIGACFSNNSFIQKITFGEQVTSIGSNAFTGCTGLTEVDIPSNVTSIGSSAFQSCSFMTKITIPSSVTSIGSEAFSGCTSLTDITSEITDVFITGANAFEGCENATLHVPAGTYVAYSGRADWNRIIHIEESASSSGLQMTLACNTKGSVLINDETRFTNKIGDVEVKEDEENTFVFTPNDGCKLEQVTLNGLDVIASVSNNRLVARIPANSQMNVVFCKSGDLNNDGSIDISDVVALVNLILGQ